VGHHSAMDLIFATGIAFVIGDRAAALELGGQTLRSLQPGGDRRRMSLILHMIAGTLADTRLEAAAIILGASEGYSKAPLPPRQLVTASATAAFGEERTRELHARGAGLDWDQAVAYTLTQAAAALEELQPGIPA
jgi:hypothetical protein